MGQKIEKIVQEDLNIGTDMSWVTAPGGGELRSTQLGLHSFARGQREYTATWAPGAITAGSKASTTVTVPDAAVADFVTASHDQILTSNLRIAGHVSAANTAKVVIHNPTASSVTVASGTVSVLVFPVIAATPVSPIVTAISGTVTCTDLGGPAAGCILILYLYDGASFVEYDTEVTGADGTYSFTNIVPTWLDEGKYLCYISYTKPAGVGPPANTSQAYLDDGVATVGYDIAQNCAS